MDVEGCLKKDLEVYQSSKGHFYEFCWHASFSDFMIFQEKKLFICVTMSHATKQAIPTSDFI